MGRRRRRQPAAWTLAVLGVVAAACSDSDSDTLPAGEIARNGELARLATGDDDPLIDVIANEGREFEQVEGADPTIPPTYAFMTCRAELPEARGLALAVVPFTDWEVDRADDEGAALSRLLSVVWGGGGADESQARDEYRVELVLTGEVEGCATWSLAFADPPLG